MHYLLEEFVAFKGDSLQLRVKVQYTLWLSIDEVMLKS